MLGLRRRRIFGLCEAEKLRRALPFTACEDQSERNPTGANLTGAMMKLSLRYKNVEEREPVEAEVERHAEKLGRLLRAYEGDLVQLHGACEKDGRKLAYRFALNLVLPTGTLHATGSASTLRASCKQAFGEIEAQIKKHQQRLRKDYEWKRKRPRVRPAA